MTSRVTFLKIQNYSYAQRAMGSKNENGLTTDNTSNIVLRYNEVKKCRGMKSVARRNFGATIFWLSVAFVALFT